LKGAVDHRTETEGDNLVRAYIAETRVAALTSRNLDRFFQLPKNGRMVRPIGRRHLNR
jgi:hypothetical protein